MFCDIPDVLDAAALGQLRAIAARAPFIDGRISAVGSPVKKNVRIGDAALQQSSGLVGQALIRSEDFRVFAFPKTMTPPLLTRYDTGMHYGIHVDAAFMPSGQGAVRTDLSCTVFISDPGEYEGGELEMRLGAHRLTVKGKAGSAIVYPSTTIHQVRPVTAGSRLVALTFIESRIANSEHREWLYELGEVMAIAGEGMDIETYTRLSRVKENLLRYWAEGD